MKILKNKIEDYFECTRCNINSLGKSMCPCPRGSCEAKIIGTITTTKSLDRNISQEQLEWNTKNNL